MSRLLNVLLITFNRPGTTKLVLERILDANPTKLFVFSDGPRKHVPSDEGLVGACRDMVTAAVSQSGVPAEYFFMDENLGCGRGVSTAITMAFERVETLIILEDDCLPHPTFFSYCSYALEKFAANEAVMHVSGTRWNPEYATGPDSLFFSSIGHIWGWATWRRAWAKYDFLMHEKNYLLTEQALSFFRNKRVAKFWKEKLDYAHRNISGLNTWDYQWQYTLFTNFGICVNPNVNLVSNIGAFGAHGNGNTVNLFSTTGVWKADGSADGALKQNIAYDVYHTLNHFMVKEPLYKRAFKKLKKIVQ